MKRKEIINNLMFFLINFKDNETNYFNFISIYLKTILYFLIIFIFTISIIVISNLFYSHLSKKDNVSDKSKFLISNFHPLFKIGKNTLKNLYVYESS